MKVCFLTNLQAPYKIKFFNKLSEKIDVTVIIERASAKNRDPAWVNIEKRNFEQIILDGLNYGEESSFSLKIIWLIMKGKYEIFVVGGYSSLTSIAAIFALKMLRRPFVLSIDGAIYEKRSFIKAMLKKCVISAADWYFSPGRETDEYLKIYGAKGEKIFRVPFSSVSDHQILPKVLHPAQKEAFKKALNLEKDLLILAVGQFIERKGFDVLLNAVPSVNGKISVCLVGGQATRKYEEIVEKYSLTNIRFFKFMPSEKLEEFYTAADVFVLPTREDIWGLVINEAMAYGLPVISTNKCNSAMELVRDGSAGFVIPADDPKELARRITELIDNDELRERMSRNSLRIIRNHTIERMASEFIKIFHEIK